VAVWKVLASLHSALLLQRQCHDQALKILHEAHQQLTALTFTTRKQFGPCRQNSPLPRAFTFFGRSTTYSMAAVCMLTRRTGHQRGPLRLDFDLASKITNVQGVLSDAMTSSQCFSKPTNALRFPWEEPTLQPCYAYETLAGFASLSVINQPAYSRCGLRSRVQNFRPTSIFQRIVLSS
jgi:hypothetical protein